MSKSKPDWGWYASSDGEVFTEGPEGTREGIIEVALENQCGLGSENEDGSWDYSFEIVEAYKAPIELADYFDAGHWIEELDNGALCDLLSPDGYGDGLGEQLTNEQFSSLEAAVKAAIAKWQEDHNFNYVPWGFSGTRNREDISGKHEPSTNTNGQHGR